MGISESVLGRSTTTDSYNTSSDATASLLEVTGSRPKCQYSISIIKLILAPASASTSWYQAINKDQSVRPFARLMQSATPFLSGLAIARHGQETTLSIHNNILEKVCSELRDFHFSASEKP